MAGGVRFQIEGDPDKALAALQKVVSKQDEVIQQLKKGQKASTRAGKATEKAWDRGVQSVKRLMTGYLGIHGMISTIRKAYGEWKQDVEETERVTERLVDNFRTLAVMKGEKWPGYRAAIGRVVGRYTGPGGVGAAYRGAEAVESLMPAGFGYTREERIASTRQALRFATAYGMEPMQAATLMGKASGMLGEYGLTPQQWSNALAQTIEAGGYAGPRLAQWADAFPKLFGGAITAKLTPAQTLAFAQLMSQVTGQPAEGMSAGEQVLRKVGATKAAEAIPRLGGLGVPERLGVLADMFRAGTLDQALMEKAFGARGMKHLAKALGRWDLYEQALPQTQAALALESDVVREKLRSVRATDPAVRFTDIRRTAVNLAELGRLEDIEGLRTGAGREILQAISVRSGQSPIGRFMSRSIYHTGRWFGLEPVDALGAAFGFNLMPGNIQYSDDEMATWQRVRPVFERALSGESTEELRKIRKNLENGRENYAPEEPRR
ncbi:MAG: hypothetical protein PVH68_04780 [Armatimonadota bacterium]|jgi:uncharacterized protein (DUF697 family)